VKQVPHQPQSQSQMQHHPPPASSHPAAGLLLHLTPIHLHQDPLQYPSVSFTATLFPSPLCFC